MRRLSSCLFISLLVLIAGPLKAAPYVFGWQFIELDSMQPRGGTTQGPEVTLDTEISKEFQRIHEAGLSKVERDRRAILAMSGPYRVGFDFLEVAGYQADFAPASPYRSWGTEFVYVVANEEHFVSLQHLLVMSIIDAEGHVQGPFVTKHWRQDWHYELTHVHRYQGQNSWERMPVDAEEGYWVQTVWQVDDSPRYAGVGHWQHQKDYSSWQSDPTWRPLPRREYSVRDDYDVLIGRNQHTVIADGWVHEEHNDKAETDNRGAVARRIAREYGIARYQRIKGYDFSPGDQYMQATTAYWREVRTYWGSLLSQRDKIYLKAPVDQAGLFFPLFERAQMLADGKNYDADDRAFIHSTIQGFLVDESSPDTGY